MAPPVRVHLAIRAKAAEARATKEGSDKSCDAAQHVDGATSSKVNHANAKKRLVSEDRQEATLGPDPAPQRLA
jgi:hypothetical protein